MALADFFYGDPEQNLHGWQTPRGEILVRYGRRNSIAFLPADLKAATAVRR